MLVMVLRGPFPNGGVMVAGREAVAFARQAVLLRHDRDVICPDSVLDGEQVVVLLHGLFATAGVLRPMRAAIEGETGSHTASFTYGPGPGIRALAERLAELVARLPSRCAIHLVGHSMGGLVARYYVQLLRCDPRVVQTISLASPFRGTAQARWLRVGVGRDIAPGSDVLRSIAATARDCTVPHTSFVAPLDTVITPPDSAVFWHGDAIAMPGLGHNALLYDQHVHAAVVGRIRSAKGKLAASGVTW